MSPKSLLITALSLSGLSYSIKFDSPAPTSAASIPYLMNDWIPAWNEILTATPTPKTTLRSQRWPNPLTGDDRPSDSKFEQWHNPLTEGDSSESVPESTTESTADIGYYSRLAGYVQGNPDWPLICPGPTGEFAAVTEKATILPLEKYFGCCGDSDTAHCIGYARHCWDSRDPRMLSSCTAGVIKGCMSTHGLHTVCTNTTAPFCATYQQEIRGHTFLNIGCATSPFSVEVMTTATVLQNGTTVQPAYTTGLWYEYPEMVNGSTVDPRSPRKTSSPTATAMSVVAASNTSLTTAESGETKSEATMRGVAVALMVGMVGGWMFLWWVGALKEKVRDEHAPMKKPW
ncbi:hypothetical protein GQ43DRAFT_478672 [Delitschia confertaspora ATCC 74209]|uniref:Uncharacterized protein n=1 Tax=Delitschia confertaspora ATCC 74209 TaxID=1513339 RepID=A0A9P4JRM0_9PLEO|nr:hypothetical protein GQ43DRAFT_478672 [Delitschia confertaspora ATCC 74209]